MEKNYKLIKSKKEKNFNIGFAARIQIKWNVVDRGQVKQISDIKWSKSNS